MEDGQDRPHCHPAVCHLLGSVLLCSPHCIRRVGVFVCVSDIFSIFIFLSHKYSNFSIKYVIKNCPGLRSFINDCISGGCRGATRAGWFSAHSRRLVRATDLTWSSAQAAVAGSSNGYTQLMETIKRQQNTNCSSRSLRFMSKFTFLCIITLENLNT